MLAPIEKLPKVLSVVVLPPLATTSFAKLRDVYNAEYLIMAAIIRAGFDANVHYSASFFAH